MRWCWACSDLAIELVGKNTVSGLYAGIYSNVNSATLAFSGDGFLTVTAKHNEGVGIQTRGDITVFDGAIEATATGEKGSGISTNKGLTIRDGVKSLTASGAKQAISGTVKNYVAGTGWTDVDGTEGRAAITVSEEGRALNDYKKVQFPGVPESEPQPEPVPTPQPAEAPPVSVTAHVQKKGWLAAVSGGAVAGTTGKSRRLEAVQIRLYGEMAKKYDVYYRVHSQKYGWMAWAKNGEKAGTQGKSRRGEAVQVVIVPKGAAAPGATYKGATQTYGKAFVKK